MKRSIKILFYIGGLSSIILLSIFDIPRRTTYDYSFANIPTEQQIELLYEKNNVENDEYNMAKTFITFINYSSLSLIDFLIIASIEILRVIFFEKPLYLDIEEDIRIYDEEKVPSYIQAKKKKHLLDDKEVPVFKSILTTILIVKDMFILPLSLIAYDYSSIQGIVQYGCFLTHTLLSPQVLLSYQHLAYNRLGLIQDIAEDTRNEQKIDRIVMIIMYAIRFLLIGSVLISLPILIVGSIFGLIVTLIYSLATLGLCVPVLLLCYIYKRRTYQNKIFAPLNLVIFIGVGMILSISYAVQFGNLICDGSDIKNGFQFYLGPNTFSLWYFAKTQSSPQTWKEGLSFIIRILSVI